MTPYNGHTIITIGRTFGSGGREIGRKVASELGIPFYDKELLALAAEENQIGIEYLALYDEKRPGAFMYSMAFNPYTYLSNGAETLDMIALNIQIKAIKHAADKSPCVIIGRRADQILRKDYHILSVFISAPLEKRIARVMTRDGLSEKESKKKILKTDKSRRAFYNAYGDDGWGEADHYHLCIDSGDLGIDHSAEMIIHYLKLRG